MNSNEHLFYRIGCSVIVRCRSCLTCLHRGHPSSLTIRLSSPIQTSDTMRTVTRAALRPYVCASCRYGIGAGRRRFGTKIDQTPDIYDVVCVGGGPAGLGLLAALRTSHQSSHQAPEEVF
jgi:Predicted flavoprotein involved in K+ transport